MKRDETPLMEKLVVALLAGDMKLVNKIICDYMQEVSEEMLPAINGRDKADLPFVAAAMIHMACNLWSMMDDDMRKIMDMTIKNTHSIAIDITDFVKQEGGGGI